MPSGGARKGAGRKPQPLSQKIAAGNPGHRPLKKVAFEGNVVGALEPPDYLRTLEKRNAPDVPTPEAIFKTTVKHLEPSGCLPLIGEQLIADYAQARHNMLVAQYSLSQMTAVGRQGDKKEGSSGNLVVTPYAEAVLKFQRNVVLLWTPIWDIVAKNSETFVKNPEEDVITAVLSGRVRRRRPKEDDDV